MDKQLDHLISYWQSTLISYKLIVDVTAQVLIELTIKYLKELKETKDTDSICPI